MKDYSHRLVIAIAVSCLLCILFAFLNQWIWFGLTTSLLVTVTLALGVGPVCGQRPVLAALAFVLLAYCGLVCGMAWVHDPGREPNLVLGFPPGTALLIYGIWPLGMLPGLLYPIAFDRWILPADRLDRFLAEFGRREDGSL
jgi:hypothetical protein